MAAFTSSVRRPLWLALLYFCFAPVWGMAAEPVGEVVFVAGGAELQRQGQWQKLAKGTQVQEGDLLRTAANGHIHLRMNDNGFIAVRPASNLQVRQYRYEPQSAGQNQVLLHLESGTARTISGKAGESNRERYRFTTPVAAIGLRGTDYVVQAEAELTRVSVLKGAIVLNPLGPGCAADLQSPCSTPYMRELSARTPHAYLEIQMKGETPQILLHEKGKAGTNPGVQPHPEEPQAKAEKEVLQALQDGKAGIQVPVVPEFRGIVWGRWSHIATPTPTLVSQVGPEREVTYGHELFGLLRPVEKVVLPQGSVAMRYNTGEAWLKTAQGELVSVPLGKGSLSLDFDRRQFQSSLLAFAPGVPLQLQAQGKITFQGFLLGDPGRSNMNVAGNITSHAQEAGYLFDTPHAQGTLYGATHWKR